MTQPDDPTPWRDPAWRAAFTEWISASAAAHGVTVTAIEPPRLRSWSVVAEVTTSAGTWWAKANPPGSRYEPALLDALGRWTPDAVVAPVAVHAARAWSLVPDGGPVLSAALDDDPDPRRWEPALAAYARFQRSVEGRVPDLLALGVPDFRPEALPGRLADLIESPDIAASIGQPGAASADEWVAVRGIRPEYSQWCAELASSPVRPTLDHADLHDGHVFTGGCRFFDWGDAGVAHPFASMLVPLRTARARAGLGAGARELRRLTDAYLDTWSDVDSPGGLRRALTVALRTAVISRADSWQRGFQSAGRIAAAAPAGGGGIALPGSGPDDADRADQAEARAEMGAASSFWLTRLLFDDSTR